jgi:Na+/serine symporter
MRVNPKYLTNNVAAQQNFEVARVYLIVIGWMYVALMMAVAEATHERGSILGAVFTFLLYGVGPVALVVYLMTRSGRRRARQAREAATATASAGEPDAGGKAAADPVAPVRKEP